MRSFRAFLYFSLGVMIALTWGIKSANAQGVVYNSPAGPIPTEVVGPFSSWSAGMRAAPSAVSSSGNGVALRASGIATTTLSNGARIGSTVAATGEIISPRIAALTAGFIKWGRIANPAIVAGSVAYAVYKESGYTTCPPPDFFCKPSTVPSTSGGFRMSADSAYPFSSTPLAACQQYFNRVYPPGTPNANFYGGASGLRVSALNPANNNSFDCYSSINGFYAQGQQFALVCPNGSTPVAGVCQSNTPNAPYTDSELEQAMLDKMRAEPAFAKKYWDAVLTDSLANPGYKPPVGELVNADTPITAEPIAPTTTPKEVVNKEEFQNPDGTWSTRTTEAQTTVRPKLEGTTVGDARVTTSSTTTYTTTTTNNTTNNTTTTSSTVTNNAPSETPPKRDDSFVDSGMPTVPSLYTQKYPDGLAGAWRDNKPDLSSTSFFAGVKNMFPSFSGGSCPSFALPLTIGSLLGAGTVPFNVPCSIYGFIGLVMLITAAFTARKIIF
jgi:hypothetical protein